MSRADQTFSETMRTLRKAQNLTLDALQRRTGVPLARLRDVDAGAVPPFLSEAKSISSALGTTIDAMVDGKITTYALGAFRSIAEKLPINTQLVAEDPHKK